MQAQLWKWTTMVGIGAGLMIVYRDVKQRAALLRQAVTDDDRLNEALEESFPASDPVAHTPLVGSKVR